MPAVRDSLALGFFPVAAVKEPHRLEGWPVDIVEASRVHGDPVRLGARHIKGMHTAMRAECVLRHAGGKSVDSHAVADAAKQALGVETLTVLADSGYYNGETLKDCEADGITAYVPPPQRNGRLVAQGLFSHEEFRYDADADAYRCPAEALLRPMSGHKEDASGKAVHPLCEPQVRLRNVSVARALSE